MEKDGRSVLISSVDENEGLVYRMMTKFSWTNHKEFADSTEKSWESEKMWQGSESLPDLLANFSLMTKATGDKTLNQAF